jgi:hypothetical protein
MRTTVSRRRFVRGSIRLAVVAPLIRLAPIEALVQSNRLATSERRALFAAADAIIPAVGRMPAATAVGAGRYIDRIAGTDDRLAGLLSEGARAMDTQSLAAHAVPFEMLGGEERVVLLTHIEKTDVPAGFFPALRDLVYEAYYTQPRVMKLLGYNFRSGRRRTAPIEPFDEQRVQRVRSMAPLYRRVPS